jgi:uncharacterized protein (DUF924 family)
MSDLKKSNTVFNFWFEELKPENWFQKDLELDQRISKDFKELHTSATLGELFNWRNTPRGCLCEVIVLDQFSRNIYRDNPKSFQFDGVALTLSQEAIRSKVNLELNLVEKSFLYMPFMHSESLLIHEEAIKLFEEKGLENNLQFEISHKKIIEQFGRYPHRNEILGRVSTPEEIKFLKGPNSSF